MATAATEIRVAPRFSGPPGFANGGFASGSLAVLLGGTAEVTLRRPVPLGRALAVRRDGEGSVVIEDRGARLAEARPAEVELAVPAGVTAEEAEAAAGRLRYYDAPVFPACFVCGPERAPGEGLRIFPGRVEGRTLCAAPWTPDPSVAGADGRVRPEVVWAALDCPSGLAAGDAADLPGGSMILLGRMAASLAALPRPGERLRVVGWPLGRDGRKLAAGSALLGTGGEVLAVARTLWILVRPSAAEGSAERPGATTAGGR